MANAKKCDRCGAFYESYNEANNPKKPNGVMLCSVDCSQKYWPYKTIELCPDCMKSFQVWLDMNDDSTARERDEAI